MNMECECAHGNTIECSDCLQQASSLEISKFTFYTFNSHICYFYMYLFTVLSMKLHLLEIFINKKSILEVFAFVS